MTDIVRKRHELEDLAKTYGFIVKHDFQRIDPCTELIVELPEGPTYAVFMAIYENGYFTINRVWTFSPTERGVYLDLGMGDYDIYSCEPDVDQKSILGIDLIKFENVIKRIKDRADTIERELAKNSIYDSEHSLRAKLNNACYESSQH